MSFKESIQTCLFKKYATMSGRASRAEYWWFQLFFWIVTVGIILLCIPFGRDGENVCWVLVLIFFIITLIPNLCVFVRRLHDRGHSGAIFWFSFIISIFGVILIGNIINLLGSDEGDNEYGPNPYKQLKNEAGSRVDVDIDEKFNEEITDVEL